MKKKIKIKLLSHLSNRTRKKYDSETWSSCSPKIHNRSLVWGRPTTSRRSRCSSWPPLPRCSILSTMSGSYLWQRRSRYAGTSRNTRDYNTGTRAGKYLPASTNASYVLSNIMRICGSSLSASFGCMLKNVESNFVTSFRTPILVTAPPTPEHYSLLVRQ